jgi:hypothetical protein
MSDDVVTRLRVIAAEFPRLNEIMDGEWASAADEIERLRKENNDLREIVALHGEVVKLAQKRHEERDDARREICQIMHYTGYLGGDYANHRKWDCYKDGKHHPPSAEIRQNFEEWLDGQLKYYESQDNSTEENP